MTGQDAVRHNVRMGYTHHTGHTAAEVRNFVTDGTITPNKTCSPDALYFAAEWVESYETEDLGEAQELADAAAAIVRLADSMRKRRALAAAKREYAAQHGVPVSSVRVKR